MKEIYKLLNHIQTKLEAKKSQYNKTYDYYYRNAEDILEGVKKVMGDACIILADEPIKFNEELTLMKSTAKLILGEETIENTSYVEIPKDMPRMSAPQKWTAISSYCRKVALTGLFACNDEKDLDRLSDDKRNNNNNNNNNNKNSNKKNNNPFYEKKTENVNSRIKKAFDSLTDNSKNNEMITYLNQAFKVNSFIEIYKKHNDDKKVILDKLTEIYKEKLQKIRNN